MFFRPNLVNEETIDNLIRGLSVNKMKQKNVRLVDSIRNLLVEDPKKQQVKLDLYSLNIQRGRDHGLPSYNDVRHAFGLPKLRYFYELTSDSEVARKLSEIYDSINDLDLIVGIFA